jgi:hypothetical protein
MRNIRNGLFLVLIFLVAGLIVSCSPKSTPPGSSSTGGVVEGARYTYHYWEEGLAILIWHDFTYGGEGCSGTGSTEDSVFKLECDVDSADGDGFNWKVHTSDGVTADVWIEDQSFDPTQGTMFLVSSIDGNLEVKQFQRDFSELEPTHESISALAGSDPDVANFLESIDPPADLQNPEGMNSTPELIEALQLAGQPVEIAGQVDQPFFSVPGQIIVVDGEDVQVFEYPDAAAAEIEAAQIAPDASSVATSMLSWAAAPHFYSKDRLIVLYVGENESVTRVLVDALGEPIAEGQGALLPSDNDSTFEPEPAGMSIVSTLPDVLTNREFGVLLQMMDDPFIIGYWLSEGLALSPAEAIEQLQKNLLPDSSAATFTVDPEQFPDLGEFDPLHAFGPDVQITDLIYSQGWGTEGKDEAILTVAQRPDGSRYWHGIIYGGGGFAAIPGEIPDKPVLSFEAATYRNEDNGFEFDYPAAWYFTEQVYGPRGSGAQFFSEDEIIFSSTVYLWDPKNDLDAYIDIRKQGWSSSSAVISEEELFLADGRRAVLYEIQGPDGSSFYSLLTEVGQNYLELTGPIELVEFVEIAGTVRALEGAAAEPLSGLADF